MSLGLIAFSSTHLPVYTAQITGRTNQPLTASTPGLPYLQMKGLDQIIDKVLPTLKTFN